MANPRHSPKTQGTRADGDPGIIVMEALDARRLFALSLSLAPDFPLDAPLATVRAPPFLPLAPGFPTPAILAIVHGTLSLPLAPDFPTDAPLAIVR